MIKEILMLFGLGTGHCRDSYSCSPSPSPAEEDEVEELIEKFNELGDESKEDFLNRIN